MIKISLIHPSRGRAEKALETRNTWIKKSGFNNHFEHIEHILSIDKDDPETIKYAELFFTDSKLVVNHTDTVVAATNNAASVAKGEILIYLSDDFDCPDNWAVKLIQKFAEFQSLPALLKVHDDLQGFDVRVLTIPIMNRHLYDKLGYFFHPEYRSMFCDQHLYEITAKNNWLYFAPELVFPHNHCSIGKSPNDNTYARSSQNWDQGKELYAKHKAQNFPL